MYLASDSTDVCEDWVDRQEGCLVNVWGFPWCWNSSFLLSAHSSLWLFQLFYWPNCQCFCFFSQSLAVHHISHHEAKIDCHDDDGNVNSGYHVYIITNQVQLESIVWLDPDWLTLKQNGNSVDKFLFCRKSHQYEHPVVSVRGAETSASGNYF